MASLYAKIFVNSTDINRNGTLIDSLYLRFTFDVEYESTAVHVSRLTNDVVKQYVKHYRTKLDMKDDEKISISQYLGLKLVDHLNNKEKYFISGYCRDEQFTTVEDLLKYGQLINCTQDVVCYNIYLEAIPKIYLLYS